MNTTYMYSLTLPFFFMVSLLLAWGGSWLISKLYSRNVLKLMQIGLAPQHASSSKPSDTSAPLSTIPFSKGSSDLQQQNRFAILRLRVFLIVISLLLSAIITLRGLAAFGATTLSWNEFLILTLMSAWLCVPTIGLMERWSRGKIFFISLLYVWLLSILSPLYLMIWLFLSNQLYYPLIVLFFMTGPKLRSTGPFLTMVFFVLIVLSFVGFFF